MIDTSWSGKQKPETATLPTGHKPMQAPASLTNPLMQIRL